MSRSRLLFSCVTESGAEWLSRVQALVFSLREFGGSSSDAPFIVNFVGSIPERAERALADLGAEARRVEPVRGQPTANKLRMLDLHDSAEFDVLVALDCDTVVVGDPRPHITAAAIGAKPADQDPFRRRDWRRLYRALDLPAPAWDLRATSTGKPIPPYFNSGVLTVPRGLCEDLRQEWMTAHAEVTSALGRDSHLVPKHLHFFSDQLSLGLCIVRGRLPLQPLPLAMNFPSHVGVEPVALTDEPAPIIIHYHHARDEHGFLYRPRSSAAVERTNAFNIARASRLGVPYPGLRAEPRVTRLTRRAAHRFWSILAVRQRLRASIGGPLAPGRSSTVRVQERPGPPAGPG